MVIEILFSEACNLYGDGQNITYLRASLPEAEFVYTSLTDEPYFVNHTPDMIYIGSMSESIQRRVIEKLMPYKQRLQQLIDANTLILATGNAGEIFAKSIDYITEKIQTEALGIFDLTVKTDWFDRYNSKVLGQFEDMQIVGFRSQFSFWHGDNADNYFVECIRGDGIHKASKLEGVRIQNLFCTQILGPILPLNPMFCAYLMNLLGCCGKPAYYEAAICAYEQRVKEFSDPNVVF